MLNNKDETEDLEFSYPNVKVEDNAILHKSTFNSKIKNQIFKNLFDINSQTNIKSSYFKKYSNNIFENKPLLEKDNSNKIKMNRNRAFSKTFGRSKLNYEDIINFNFGSKKPNHLKLVNTSVLASNASDQKNDKSILIKKNVKEKRTSLFNKKNNANSNHSKYFLGDTWSKNFEKKEKYVNLSERKSISNNNGILKLPLLSSLITKTKIKNRNDKDIDENDKETIIKKHFKEKNYKKIRDILDKDEEITNKKIEEKFKLLDDKIKKYKLKRPNEETEEGIEALFKKYNEKRAKKFDIITNRTLEVNENAYDFINIHTMEEIEYYNKNKLNNILLDVKGNPSYMVKLDDKEKDKKKLKDYELISLANRANIKVEKFFPD